METETATLTNRPNDAIADTPWLTGDPDLDWVVEKIECGLSIRDKWGQIRPFLLNSFQRRYLRRKVEAREKTGSNLFLVLKPRRVGITTLEEGVSYVQCATRANMEALTLAHEKDDTEKIFRIDQLFYRTAIPELKPFRRTNNKRELNFERINSLFYIGTAGSDAPAQGPTLQRIHGSEVSLFPGGSQDIADLVAGLLESCSEGEVVFESRPHRAEGWFFDTYSEAKDGKNKWNPIFLAWYENPEYSLPANDWPSDMTFEEKSFIAAKKLTPGQLAWRRDKQKRLGKNFLSAYAEDDISCFALFSSNYFDDCLDMIRDSVKLCAVPVETRSDGFALCVKPQTNHRYIVAADTSEGVKGGDYSYATVLDVETCEQCAWIHGRWAPEVFAEKCAALARQFDGALLAVESNNHGHSVLNSLKNALRYPALYHHQNYDETHESRLGFQTNARTRPVMLSQLKDALGKRLLKVNDPELLRECMTFVHRGSGHYGAKDKHHDDRVIAAAIGWYVRQLPRPIEVMPRAAGAEY